MSLSARRSVVASALLTVLLPLVGLVLAAPADASPTAPAFRFWGYFQQADGAWQFAQTGPDDASPADGSVEGWRFATAASDDVRYPRATPTFEDVCGMTEPAGDSKRVAVVIDFGRDADGGEGAQPPAARAACAQVPEAATGSDVLAAVAETRAESGLMCAIDSYPASGCGEPVDPLPPAAAAPDQEVQLAVAAAETAAGPEGSDPVPDDGGPGAGLWVGVAAVVLVAGLGAAALARRRGTGD